LVRRTGGSGGELVPTTVTADTSVDSLGIDVLVLRDQLRLFVNGRPVGAPTALDAKLNGYVGLLVTDGSRHRFSDVKIVSLRAR
jgi:hypothetical protein